MLNNLFRALMLVILATSMSVHAQQCTETEMKKVMSEMPDNKKADAAHQSKLDEKLDTLAKLKHWNAEQKSRYGMNLIFDKNNYAAGQDPMANMTKMMNAIAKKDCKTLETMNKTAIAESDKTWTRIYKVIDEDIAKAK